jgi:hypothetical protein
LIEPGNAYRIIDSVGSPSVMYIHQILQNSHEIILSISQYVFLNSVFGKFAENATDEDLGQLLLVYENWTNGGEKTDAVSIPLMNVKQVIEVCTIQYPPVGLEGLDVSSAAATQVGSSRRSYLVKWGISSTFLTSSRNNFKDNSEIALRSSFGMFELRNLHNRANYIVLDQLDLNNLPIPFTAHEFNCGIGGSTVGFSEFGFNVKLAVESDEYAAKTWKVTPIIRLSN